VHESIETWRNEALGASFKGAAIPATVALEPAPAIRPERRLSALAALREFFTVSPLWLRGATTVAALLLCVLGIMMVARLSRRPAEIATAGNHEEMYTRQQLDEAVNNARKAAELSRQPDTSTPIVATKVKPKSETNRVQFVASQQSKNLRPQRLSRQEREQLAADLRLTPSVDEEEMLLAFPDQEHPNQ